MRTFLSVARNRSISRAARELFATQPTISLRVKRLESELGFPVFSRSWRGVELTPEGRHILPTIADHLFRLQTASTMTQEETGHAGIASILNAHAAPESVAVDDWIVGEGIADLVRTLGELESVHLTVTNAARLQAMVAHGVCTRGVTYSTHSPNGWATRETTLWTEPLAVVRPWGDLSEPPYTAETLREFFRTRRFILMEDPVFTDHAGITGPMLEAIAPLGTTVVDHTSIMASLCTVPGNATLVPSGLCARKSAFAQDGLAWSVLDPSWPPMSVVMLENELEPTQVEQNINHSILQWARSEA